ncbi:helix-turn-helix domain-containing protein [Actinoplanes ianthinogenes]|nr:helix-turn-helix transcriptional regulator [Actinoplanes ianthinogenes]
MPLLRQIIGSVLRRVRRHQGRTLKEVATAAGVSLPYLSEVERGTKEVSSEILAAICRALGLPMTDLLDLVRQEMMRQPLRPAGRYTLATADSRQSATTDGRQSATADSRQSATADGRQHATAHGPRRNDPTCSVTGRRPARVHAGGRPRTALPRVAARIFVTC